MCVLQKEKGNANNLQAMCQVAISIWEIRLKLQGCTVRCYGLRDVSRILKTQDIKIRHILLVCNSTKGNQVSLPCV